MQNIFPLIAPGETGAGEGSRGLRLGHQGEALRFQSRSVEGRCHGLSVMSVVGKEAAAMGYDET